MSVVSVLGNMANGVFVAFFVGFTCFAVGLVAGGMAYAIGRLMGASHDVAEVRATRVVWVVTLAVSICVVLVGLGEAFGRVVVR